MRLGGMLSKLWALPRAVGTLLALVAIYLIFAWLAPETFATAGTAESIVRQSTVVGMAALGMTAIIIVGGIDLSVGSVVALVTVAIAWSFREWQVAPWQGALVGIAAGGIVGLINGTLITSLRMVPFIVTLGMMMAARGAAKGIAENQKIDAPRTWLNELLARIPPDQGWMLIPPGAWLVLLVAVLVALLLHFTRLGKHIFAVGSNEETARLCGVRTGRVKVIVFTLGGLAAGLAGVLRFGRLGVGDPSTGLGLELRVIAAVVIGGGSLAGGEGSVLGTLLGALIMSVIATGGTHLGWSNWVQEILTGGIIITAVALDRFRHRRTA
ncbi:MAG: ABC transporter permease [Planctomycetota bacterium]